MQHKLVATQSLGTMAKERLRKDRIEIAFRQNSTPLFEVWSDAAKLSDLEKRILWLKKFDERCPTEDMIMEQLQQEFNYYCSDRAFRKMWHKIVKKIEKLMP